MLYNKSTLPSFSNVIEPFVNKEFHMLSNNIGDDNENKRGK